jgi:hypothetical protein
MTVTADQLRTRMASLSGDELRAVKRAPDGEYIAEAREAARRELALRAGGAVSQPSSERSSLSIADHDRAFYPVEDAVWSMWDVLRSLPRKELPNGLRALFWTGVSTAFCLAVSVVSAFARGGSDLQAGLNEAIGFGWQHPYITLLGTAGVPLAYGIYTRRTYPRWLAIGVVVLMSGETLHEQLRHNTISSDLYYVPVATWATIKYLFRSAEVSDYYFRIHNGGSPRSADLNADEALSAQNR